MCNFELRLIESIRGKQSFYRLIVDGVDQYQLFYEEIRTNKQYVAELRTILQNMDFVAGLGLPHESKYKNITPKKEQIGEHEFKTKHLRVYCFHIHRTGKIVAHWGLKSNQPDDIREFRRIKRLYLKSIGL